MNTNETTKPPQVGGSALNDGLDTNKEIEFIRECLQGVRYGVAWKGDPKKPTLEEMPDGYWVPWHVADVLLVNLKENICEQVSNAELTGPR